MPASLTVVLLWHLHRVARLDQKFHCAEVYWLAKVCSASSSNDLLNPSYHTNATLNNTLVDLADRSRSLVAIDITRI
jgi:hypothetical protein